MTHSPGGPTSSCRASYAAHDSDNTQQPMLTVCGRLAKTRAGPRSPGPDPERAHPGRFLLGLGASHAVLVEGNGTAYTKGGFRRSSQHLEGGGCDECSEAAFGRGPAGEVPFAWPAGCGEA